MRKFYMMMLAMLCVVSTAMAQLSDRKPLDVKKALKTEVQTTAKKQSRTGVVQTSRMVPSAKAQSDKLSQLAGKHVTGMRKADANPSIEGTWTFALGDYYFQTSVGQMTYDFEATLDGNDVWFEDPTGYEMPFFAEFDEANGKLTFNREYLSIVNGYYIYQEPFIYNYTTDDLDVQSIVATYNAQQGIIQFASDNGISWPAYSAQSATYNDDFIEGYFGIYDLEGATRPYDDSADWTELGEASFIENIVYTMFNSNVNTTASTHTIYESNITPGIYKIENPFSTLYAALNKTTTSPDMIIDATDPDNVKIELQSTGISASASGQSLGVLYYFNTGWYNENYSNPLDHVSCTLTTSDDGLATITMPYRSCYILASATSGLYYGAGDESVLTFQLPAAEAEVVGTYDWTIQPTDMEGTRSEAVTLQVEVKKDANDNYTLAEVGETNYFNGTTIPFTYDGTNATFTAFYAGQMEGNYVWFSPFVYNATITEPQPKYAIAFDAETGFAPNDDAGFGWFTCEAADDFSPSDLYVGYFLKAGDANEGGEGGEGEGGDVSYPEFSTLVGTHTFTATLELLDDAYAEQLLDAYEFRIDADKSVGDFIATNDQYFTYDQEAGTLTFRTNNWGSWLDFNTWKNYSIGIADAEGNWQGVGNYSVVWNVDADGHIIIPDFTVINYNDASYPVVARYTNCKVDGYPADEAEEGDITGNMTAQVDMNQGMGDEPDLVEDADTFEVTATYDADTKKLTIYNFAESKPITFTVDVEAATATGDADQVAYVEDYGGGDFVSYYYYNIEQQNTAVTAKIYSTDDNKTVLYVDPWGEGADFGPDFGWFNIVAYYNTVVTLDFAIEGLPTKPADDEGDATLEGYWNIPLNDHYAGAWSLGAFTGKYEVTVDGTTVRFTDTEDIYDMVGELTADNKVVFRKTSVGRIPSTYVLTQVPYVNENGTNEIEELTFIDAITATYNAKESTITFPENSGLAYGYFHRESGLLSYWHAAFDFNGVGTKTGELQSSLTISSLHPEIDENDVTITFDVEAVRLDFASVASWKVQVTEHFSDVAAEKNWDETSMVDATVEDGVGTVVLTNMSNGVHNLSIVLIAYDENGEQIIASNSKDAGITVGPEIMIRAPKATVEGNNVTVTFDASVYGISLDKIASYKALFTDLTTATDDYAGDTTTEDATVEDGVATVTLTNLNAGSYDYSVALIAYNADGEALATSNTLQFVFTIDVPTGINGVTEGTAVRYYNLQGVEVTNPAAGSIVIKVEGNKAVKVLIK